uniref:Uncharacterized protein n=1 Tax=Rhizophagus irregularis (strain DAOM 181602 / DAOM 197198 / MUCL 43194) TaxID=747089 RepID=U9SV42_RHIID
MVVWSIIGRKVTRPGLTSSDSITAWKRLKPCVLRLGRYQMTNGQMLEYPIADFQFSRIYKN